MEDLFNDRLLAKIESFLRTGSIHRASISFRLLKNGRSPLKDSAKLITFEASEQSKIATYTRSEREDLFHIASITKMLVAAAMVHAIEVKSTENTPHSPWAKFKGIQDLPITTVCNQYIHDPSQKLIDIPGHPTIYDLLLHSKGLPTFLDHILAPDGTQLLGLQHLREDLLHALQDESIDTNTSKRWTRYSNVNYALIALVIDTLWDGSTNDFMQKTLLDPLKLHSTSIGYPENWGRVSDRWTVDEQGERRRIHIPEYKIDGAEAMALGGYSTARDIDSFLSSIIRARFGSQDLKLFSKTARVLLRMQNNVTEDGVHYTPFGLYTTLNASIIGQLSVNGLQFPEKSFTQYAVVPKKIGQEYQLHYMAGSTVGCCCTTALRIDSESSFVLVILTNTSGPIDVADHTSRLIMRRHVKLQHSRMFKLPSLNRRQSIKEAVAKAKRHAIENWTWKAQEEQRLKEKAPRVTLKVEGTFDGVGFHQRLQIERRNQRHYLTVCGISASSKMAMPARSTPFELVWTSHQTLRLCVPPHMSIDRLDNGDWSNLEFEVLCRNDVVLELHRTNFGRKDRFKRIS